MVLFSLHCTGSFWCFCSVTQVENSSESLRSSCCVHLLKNTFSESNTKFKLWSMLLLLQFPGESELRRFFKLVFENFSFSNFVILNFNFINIARRRVNSWVQKITYNSLFWCGMFVCPADTSLSPFHRCMYRWLCRKGKIELDELNDRALINVKKFEYIQLNVRSHFWILA